MGRIFDYIMTGDWEQTQRIHLYKEIEKLLKSKRLSNEDLEEIKRRLKEKEEE